MFKRIFFFTYGSLSYLIFLGTFLYAIGFIGNFGVPRTLDGAPSGPLVLALLIDVGLLTLFAVQHSVMARKWFKDWWTRIVPKPLERSTYVLLSSLALILLFWQWQPLGGVVWSIEDPFVTVVIRGLFAFGWALVLVSTFLINHFDSPGQAWLVWRSAYTIAVRNARPYRLVDTHCTSAGRSLLEHADYDLRAPALSIAASAYILLAIHLRSAI